jgi:Protein of unknown function (DUF2752)
VINAVQQLANTAKQKTGTWVWLSLLLLTPILLWLLPGNYFDNGKIATCPSKLFFNVECLGCGMTRAVMHFHHFQFDDAVYYNTGSVVIYPILIIVWIVWVLKASRKLGLLKKKA